MPNHTVPLSQQPIFRLYSYLRKYTIRFWTAVFSSIVNKIFDLMPPLLVGWTVAAISKQAPDWAKQFIHSTDPWHLVIFFAILTIVVFMAESIFEWIYEYCFMTLTQQAQHDLRIAAYRAVQDREMAFFEQHRVGETMSVINDDINQLERFLNTGLNDIIQLITLIIFSSYILFINSWQLALIGLATLPIIIWCSLIFQRKIGPRYKIVRQAVGSLATRLENNLSGITVIKSFTAEEFETQRLAEASQQYRVANYEAIKLAALFTPFIRMAVAISFGGILLIGGYWILHGQFQISLGQLVMFSMLIQRLLWPLTRLGATLDSFERANASARRVFNLLDSHSTIKEPFAPKVLGHAQGKIGFNQVGFHYDNQLAIVKNLNFTINPGETVGIAGHTGAGKSTLIKLLLRFYDVTSGAITIDNLDIRDITLNDLRRNIALVSQDVYLFHGSILENIAYGLTDAPYAKIIQAAKSAHLDEFVRTLPQGYDTIVGERGIKLSGGQRQRLSIARAILKDAPILILDEATSSVDTETEKEIQQNLKQITAGRTALIIAHRLSTIREANRILVLRGGQLVEEGHHDDLVALNGSYADLWNIQCGNIGLSSSESTTYHA